MQSTLCSPAFLYVVMQIVRLLLEDLNFRIAQLEALSWRLADLLCILVLRLLIVEYYMINKNSRLYSE